MGLRKIALLGLIFAVIAWHSREREAVDPALSQGAQNEDLLVERPSGFRCEGKTHCSQMSSCAEATFYLQNCPGTKIDGDGDGIPCETQYCGQ
jgi:hypothetical protein